VSKGIDLWDKRALEEAECKHAAPPHNATMKTTLNRAKMAVRRSALAVVVFFVKKHKVWW
jgi:hypothetical protein